MAVFKKLFLSLIFASLLCGMEKDHVAYLMTTLDFDASIKLYDEYQQQIGRHDVEMLVRLGTSILEQGIRSPDPAVQLSSLYGTAVAQMNSSLNILEHGLASHSYETQTVAIQLLAMMRDDRADELLTKAMSSPFLMARMEAGFYLAERKHRKASGHLEALMYRLPHEYRFYFPQFFALIGTSEAIEVLKSLMEDRFSMTRVEAILAAARFGRDDLLRKIRAHATHPDLNEQEAAAAALGTLKDSKSIPQLKRLSQSAATCVKLSALRSLYLLGDTEALLPILDLAKQKDLFAIALLGELPAGEEVLASLTKDPNIHVRFNAAYSLLLRRDPRAASPIQEFLFYNPKDLGFIPHPSLGHSLTTWKIVPSVEQQMKNLPFDLVAMSLHVREHLLSACLELPEHEFLDIAERLFRRQEYDLVPHLVHLLENHPTQACLDLLKKYSEQAGSPLIRNYCNLSLFRLQKEGPYEARLKKWISEVQTQEMVHFRSSLPWHLRKNPTTYELTPHESTRLLLEGLQTLSDRHDQEGVEILLNALRKGHPKNRMALAGLLIHSLQ